VIAYQLICDDGHEFEAWFKDSTSYDSQEKARQLACPLCGDTKISKAIMAPAVKASVTKAKGREIAKPQPPAKQQTAPKVQQYFSGLRKFIEENSEYVGRKFPEEARKIHYGESEQRHIHGESTIAEAKELIEEGIDVAPMPPDPTDLN